MNKWVLSGVHKDLTNFDNKVIWACHVVGVSDFVQPPFSRTEIKLVKLT